MQSATPERRQRRPTLDFAPLEAAIQARITIRKEQPGAYRRDLNDFLASTDRGRYYRAQRTGRINIDHAEDLCERFGWHPREIWTNRAWDELACDLADRARRQHGQRQRAWRARKKAAAA
jgi:hypothetical protein